MDENLMQERAKSIANGINWIAERFESAEVNAEHDVIYCGHDEEPQEEERATMKLYGWHWDDDLDSWYFFT